LPADTFGVHKNGEVAFSYTIGECITNPCVFNYGSWSNCDSSGYQTRTYSSTPNGCLGTPPEDSIRRSCSISVNDFVQIFPNPANNTINLRFNTNINNLQTELINSSGQMVYKGFVNSIDVRKFSTGVYFLKIDADDNHVVKKIMIQH
jgi:hypothetical protein